MSYKKIIFQKLADLQSEMNTIKDEHKEISKLDAVEKNAKYSELSARVKAIENKQEVLYEVYYTKEQEEKAKVSGITPEQFKEGMLNMCNAIEGACNSIIEFFNSLNPEQKEFLVDNLSKNK